MKKRITIIAITMMLSMGCLMSLPLTLRAEEKDSRVASVTQDMGALLKSLDSEEVKELFDFLKKEIENESWDTKEGIDAAIARGEKEFDVSLTKDQKEKIHKVIKKFKDLKIAPEFILEQAEKIYSKYGDKLTEEASKVGEEVIKETKEQIRQEVNKSIKDYFADMVGRVKSFFKGFFAN